MSIVASSSTNISINSYIRAIHPDYTSTSTNVASDDWGNNGMYPLPTEIGSPVGQIQWSEMRNRVMFQQDAVAGGASGTISIVSPHASALYNTNGNTYVSAMVDITNYTPFTWRASATYPNYVGGWYTGANGTGTQIVAGVDPNGGTGHVHNLDFTVTGTSYITTGRVYAYFINAHA